MICSQCKNRNAIGNKFCRECGAALPLPESPMAIEEAARAERERLNERVAGLLSGAYTLAEQKRYDMALPLAEEAAMLLPDSTAALSLLATLYEYSGEDEKAIKAMERVVALNPESPADRQKLGQLRRAFQEAQSDDPFPLRGAAAHTPRPTGKTAASTAQVSRRPVKWAPYIFGGAACACVLGTGLAILNGRHSGHTTADAPQGAVTPTDLSATGMNPGGVTYPSQATLASTTGAAASFPVGGGVNYGPNGDPFVSNSASGSEQPRRRERSYDPDDPLPPLRQSPRNYPSQLTNSSAGENGQVADNAPVTALPPIIAVPPGGNANQNGGDSGPVRIAAGPPAQAASDNNSAASAPSNQRQEYIKVTMGGSAAGRSAAANSNSSAVLTSAAAASGETPLMRARRLQMARKYRDAISAYRESLSADGSNAGAAQQGIAQCDEALNDDNGARAAYIDALHAYEAQLQAGRSVGQAQSGINACKAWLEGPGSSG